MYYATKMDFPLKRIYFVHACSVMSNSGTAWTGASQAPLSMGFSRQEYWSGLPFSSPGDLPDPGLEPASSVLASEFFTTEPPGIDPKDIFTYC